MFPFKKNRKQAAENGEDGIQVDKDTSKPGTAWERLRLYNPCQEVPLDRYLSSHREENSLRFVCMSDTHGAAENERREYLKRIPDGDVLIHCGDFSMGGNPSEIIRFDNFMSKLPHPVKLVIAGNHELTLDKDSQFSFHPMLVRKELGLPIKSTDEQIAAACIDLLQHMVYLQDETITICGIKIYCSPWVPTFGCGGFSLRRGENLLKVWNKIPSDTDILVTHGPPCGYGDTIGRDNHAGCVELLNTVVKRVKPKFHVLDTSTAVGYGMWTNGRTTFINSAVCSNKYKPDNDPIVFDIPLPSGHSRSDFAQLSTEKLRQARKIPLDSGSETQCSMVGDDVGVKTVAPIADVHKELLAKVSAEEVAAGVASVCL